MYRIFIIIVLFHVLITSIYSQVISDLTIANEVGKYINQNGFSGTILVAKQGNPIFHQSYGLAYYSTPDTIRNQYHYSIASVTKMFTSIKVLQLVDKGTLSLDHPVTKFLPEYEALIPEQVSIHHLLLHISGLPKEKDRLYRQKFEPKNWVEEVLAYRSKTSLGQFRYNNLDYVLLALIIEKLTGNSWEEEIENTILKPLLMNETGFLQYGNYPNNFAYTYSEKGKGLKQDPLFYIENFYAAGSMYSTTTDLLRLDQALYSNQLLSDESKKLLSKSYPEFNYSGYGVWNYQYPYANGSPLVMERRGGILGANVVLVRLTDDNYTIVILSNDDRFNPDSFGDASNLREILIRNLYE